MALVTPSVYLKEISKKRYWFLEIPGSHMTHGFRKCLPAVSVTNHLTCLSSYAVNMLMITEHSAVALGIMGWKKLLKYFTYHKFSYYCNKTGTGGPLLMLFFEILKNNCVSRKLCKQRSDLVYTKWKNESTEINHVV